MYVRPTSLRHSFVVLCLGFALYQPLLAQPLDSEIAVRQTLIEQMNAWNRGDIPAFMTGYDNSPATTFVGSTVTKGYQQVLDRYLKRYSSHSKMGTLAFADLEIQMLGSDYATVIGKWNLVRTKAEGGNVGGLFTLILHNTETGWKIIQDHTS